MLYKRAKFSYKLLLLKHSQKQQCKSLLKSVSCACKTQKGSLWTTCHSGNVILPQYKNETINWLKW